MPSEQSTGIALLYAVLSDVTALNLMVWSGGWWVGSGGGGGSGKRGVLVLKLGAPAFH